VRFQGSGFRLYRERLITLFLQQFPLSLQLRFVLLLTLRPTAPTRSTKPGTFLCKDGGKQHQSLQIASAHQEPGKTRIFPEESGYGKAKCQAITELNRKGPNSVLSED
jgi:hypothetical protein